MQKLISASREGSSVLAGILSRPFAGKFIATHQGDVEIGSPCFETIRPLAWGACGPRLP